MSQINTSIIQNSGKRDVICPPKIRVNTGADCRRRAGIRLFKAMFAAVIFGGAQGAWALPIGFGTHCSVSGDTSAQSGSPDAPSFNVQSLSLGCGSQVTSNGRVVVPVVTDAGPSLFNFDQTATTSASARAQMGSLGVRSVSDATSTPQAYLYQSNGAGAITENRFGASANSLATSYWFDTFTVGGVTSPNGFVILQFSMDLHGHPSASALGAVARLLSRLLLSDGYRYNSDDILNLSDTGILSTTIGFPSFSQFSLMGVLEAQAGATAGWLGTEYTSASNAAADAFNTSDIYIDAVTPGGTYSSLSGHDYLTPILVPSPVPESGTVWLVSAGLLALMGARRRRK
jgi:hypothetical protein